MGLELNDVAGLPKGLEHDDLPVCDLTVAAAGACISAGTLTPTQLLDSVLRRIKQVETTLCGYIEVLEVSARAEAAAATSEIARGLWRGPLHGIPFAVKDTFDTAGARTTASSAATSTLLATQDAELVAQLRAAGAVLIGKLATWEFGTGNGGVYFDLPYPPARNPWDTTRFTGGSSTGAGVAVASGMALFAIGSDTTGSIRLPAGATGTLGLVPTAGRLSLRGVLPNCFSLDRAGPICRTAEDASLVLAALADGATDMARDFSASVSGMRVGVVRGTCPDMRGPDDPMAKSFKSALETYKALGVNLVEISLPVAASECLALTQIIGSAETTAIHEDDLVNRSGQLGRALRDKLLAGATVRAVDYIQAIRRSTEIAAMIDKMMLQYDAVITFGAHHLPPRLVDEPEMIAFTLETSLTPFNLSGHPALVHCTGFTETGLPTHLQVIGNHNDEVAILRLAHAYEQYTRWHERRPEILYTSPAPPLTEQPAVTSPTADFRLRADRMGLSALTDTDLHRMEELEPMVALRGAQLTRPARKDVRPNWSGPS